MVAFLTGRMGDVWEPNKLRHNTSLCNWRTQLPPASILGPILGEKQSKQIRDQTLGVKNQDKRPRILEFFLQSAGHYRTRHAFALIGGLYDEHTVREEEGGVRAESQGGSVSGEDEESGIHSLLSSGHWQISSTPPLIYKGEERPATSLNLFRHI